MLALVVSLLGAGTVLAFGEPEPAAAAPSTSQAWVTGVSAVTGTGVGAQRTLTFDTGITAVEQTTSFTGDCSMENSGAFAGTNATAFTEPDPPANARMANALCVGPAAGGGSRVASVTFSKPIIAPVIHPWNLDASRGGATGTSITGNPISLTVLDKNNALEVTGTTFNSTFQPAINAGCAGNDGSNPNGGCGSLRLTADGPIGAFTLANNTADSPLPAAGGNDSWGYALSYPTAPLTKAFDPATISVGDTSRLTFRITNPASPTQPTLTPLDFTDVLSSGLTIADASFTDNAELRLKASLIDLDADLVVIDCANRQGGPLTLSALHAADSVLYAAVASDAGVDGVNGAQRTVAAFRRHMAAIGASAGINELGVAVTRDGTGFMSFSETDSIDQLRGLAPIIEPVVPHLSIVPESRLAGEWYGNYRKGIAVRDSYAAIVGKVLQ